MKPKGYAPFSEEDLIWLAMFAVNEMGGGLTRRKAKRIVGKWLSITDYSPPWIKRKKK